MKISNDDVIESLRWKLIQAHHLIFTVMAREVSTVAYSYHYCSSRQETNEWWRNIYKKFTELAKPLPGNPCRAYCPLCHASAAHEAGFSLDEGLPRHLRGENYAHECPVMRFIIESAHDYWNKTFREADESDRINSAALTATRMATELLFKDSGSAKPELFSDTYDFRDAAGILWAEDRLNKLGFTATTNDRVRTYTREHEDIVVYADPRRRGSINFRASNRWPRGRRVKYGDTFSIQDRFVNDLEGRYLRQVEAINARLRSK